MKKITLLVLLLAGFATRSLATSVLFETGTWPPPNGMFVSLNAVPFANGVVVSNFTFRLFSRSLPLPPPAGTQIDNFSSAAQLQVSLNGGASFSPASAPANMAARVFHSSDGGGTSFFNTEMLQMDFSGGALQGGVLIRESPTHASTGQMQTRVTSNGNLISSFFDVFVEVSLDGGQTWVPGNTTVRLELRADPTSVPSDTAPTTLLPPPCCAYTNAGSFFGSYAGGIILQNTKLHYFNFPEPAPGTNGSHVYTSAPQLDFQFSGNGGVSFSQGRAPASLAMIVRYRMNEGATQFFDTEMLSLNLQGGDLPPGVMIRESPTIASVGGMTLTPTNGVYRLQSFFDIFTEVSVDGGQNWSPTTAPSRLLLDCPAEENPFPSPNTPPPTGRYICPAQYWQLYANGIVIRNMVIHSPTQSFPPPPPGGSQVQPFGATVGFRLSTDGGQSFSLVSAPANVSVRVQSSTDNGNTRYFDTEMLQLNISGGTLPAGVMIRESPTRASLGCLSERTAAADYRISSFFDVFTEISLDGGQNWLPASNGPGELVLVPGTTPETVPTPLLPPPCCAYTNEGGFFGSYPGGMILKNFEMHFFSPVAPAPGTNGSQTYTFTAQADFLYSADGGQTFSFKRAPASATMFVRYRTNANEKQIFDTEMLSLNLSGGDWPLGTMLRESPTRASAGELTLMPTGSVYQIESFFDIWTELSVDGGQTWTPGADSSRVRLGCPAEENPFPTPNFPPLTGRYISPAQYWQFYASGIVIRNVVLRSPTQSLPPPPPGGTQVHSFDVTIDFQVSTDGGQIFLPGSAPAQVSVRVRNSTEFGPTRYFDTEMLQLNISGGTLPAGVMIRESPTRASLGCLSERSTGQDYRIGSFFDVFTEISVDGGQTWSPSLSPPGEIILAPPSADLRITKTASLASALVGQMIAYNITVTNLGPGDASGVVMTDLMPANFSLNSLGASQGSFFLASNAVICYLTNVAAGASASIVINATPDSPGLRTNFASVTASEVDPNPGNNSASAVTAVQLPLLSISLIQGNVFVNWPAAAGGFRLLQRTNLLPPTLWEPVTISPVLVSDQLSVKFTPPLDTRFFELTRP